MTQTTKIAQHHHVSVFHANNLLHTLQLLNLNDPLRRFKEIQELSTLQLQQLHNLYLKLLMLFDVMNIFKVSSGISEVDAEYLETYSTVPGSFIDRFEGF